MRVSFNGLIIPVGMCVIGCQPAADPDAVAVFKGGSVTLSEVESRLAGATNSAADIGEEGLIELYRRTAESIAVDKVLKMQLSMDEHDAAFDPAVTEEVQRRAVVEIFVKARTGKMDPVTEEEISLFYQENPDQFRRPEQRDLQMIYVRFSDERPREAVDVLLRELRQRAEQGEPFDQMVRTYSESETRVTDGRLGFVSAGVLDPEVERRVFSLEPGTVSEPIGVAGGAAIFRVVDRIRAKDFDLQDVRSQIRTLLQNRALDEIVRESNDPTPEGTAIVDERGLARLMGGADPAAIILEMGERRVSVSGFKTILEVVSGVSVELLSLSEMFSEYLAMVKREQIYRAAVASGFLDEVGGQKSVDRYTDEWTRQFLVNAILEKKIWEKVDASERAVRQFFENSRPRYQRALSMWVQSLSMDAGDVPVDVRETLEQVRVAVVSGRSTLEEEAQSRGGWYEDYGWLDFDQLQQVDPKIRLALIDIKNPGLTAPFHLDGKLHVFRVVELRKPTPMEFDECAAQVRRDYFERYKQELRDEVVSDTLNRIRFVFRPEVVRQRVLMQ